MGSVGSVHSPFAPFDMNAARPLEAGNFFRGQILGLELGMGVEFHMRLPCVVNIKSNVLVSPSFYLTL